MSSQSNIQTCLRKTGGAIVFAALILALNSQSVFAADTRIGFIDLQKAISSTKDWKRGFASFKNSFKKEKDVIARKEERIKKLLDDLNKQSFVLDPKLKKKKEDEFRKQKVAFERYVEDQNNAFAKKEKEMTQKLLLQMVDVIKKIGKEKKYTMILEKKAVLYHNAGNDLTDLATKTYDRMFK